eukprot:scaffold63586_cov32-Tisochrysis_lutea.AAC.3
MFTGSAPRRPSEADGAANRANSSIWDPAGTSHPLCPTAPSTSTTDRLHARRAEETLAKFSGHRVIKSSGSLPPGTLAAVPARRPVGAGPGDLSRSEELAGPAAEMDSEEVALRLAAATLTPAFSTPCAAGEKARLLMLVATSRAASMRRSLAPSPSHPQYNLSAAGP